jgi:hypothetical protein
MLHSLSIRNRLAPSLLGAAAGLVLLSRPAPAADSVAPGLAIEGARQVGLFDAYATLPNGDRVVFDGSAMWREAADGTFLQALGTTANFVFPSFVVPDPTSTYALIGESSRGKIFRVDLAGAGAAVLADLDFNYDAEFEDAGHALVSAAPCGFSCGNEIYRLDVVTGALSLLASVSGPSGPIAIAANGDLYYGLNPDFPVTTGAILRWSQAQVSSGVLLTEGSAAVVAPGIDPASSLAFEPVYGHLFASQPIFQGTSHVDEYTADGQPLGTAFESLDYLSNLEFRRTQGIGAFQAFQPPGVELLCRGTDYSGGVSQVSTIRSRRPRASITGPGLTSPGMVTFEVRGAHPNAALLVLVGHRALYDPHESSHDAGTFLFHTGIPLNDIRRLVTVPTDASGTGTFSFFNSSGLMGTRVLQGWILDSNGVGVGSSTEAFN